MQINILAAALDKINRRKTISRVYVFLVGLLRSLCLAGFVVGVWEVIRPGSFLEEFSIFCVSFIFGIITSVRRGRNRLTAETFVKYLEFTYPQTKTSAFDLLKPTTDNALIDEWRPILDKEVAARLQYDSQENLAYGSTVLIPLALLVFVFSIAPYAVTNMLSGVRSVVSRLQWGAELQVIDGMVEEGQQKQFSLSTSNPAKIVLLEQNLIRIDLVGERRGVKHVVMLKPKDASKTGQSFQLIETLGSKRDESETGVFSLNFTVNESSELYITSMSANSPLAAIDIKKLPVPEVTLEAVASPLKDPWPDDIPLKLSIHAKAENPLDKIRLVIQTGGRVSTELVANVLAEDKLETTADYELLIEPYMKSDIAEVTIIAEAVDRSLPKPLLGRSQPLRITAASAYGRYQRTLQTLRELKTLFDNTIEENKSELDSKAREIVAEVQIQAQDSPFFDQFDRAKLFSFDRKTNKLIREFDKEEILELSAEVNDFLFEHEAIDFRERDRDFFVAVRGLSRLLEQERKDRPVKVERVTQRINEYLEERRKIWDIRVGRIPPDLVPPEYNKIKKREPFKTAMNQVAELDNENKPESDTKALQMLSKTAAEYRSWIQNLEEAEDGAKKQREQKRQQGLSSARNQLKELQKRQSEISSILDKANAKDQKELKDNWPSTRMKQTTNSEQTKRLENMLRSLSPLAAKRMELAMQRMDATVESGDSENFQMAETASDGAARLLRQAESAASKSQQQRSGSRGRRRRVSGDNYYGRSITGGDIEIKREYSVDQRYRGDILEEVRSMQSDESISKEEKNMMESYLRKIVR